MGELGQRELANLRMEDFWDKVFLITLEKTIGQCALNLGNPDWECEVKHRKAITKSIAFFADTACFERYSAMNTNTACYERDKEVR